MSGHGRWAETQLRYVFNDPALLELALTHRSASKSNNERLEYLGDSYLNFAIARRLYDLRPQDSEGDLSRARAALVKEPTLAAIGQRLSVDAQLTLGAGEIRSGGMFAEHFESLPDAATLKDTKTRLQEWLQGRGLPLPSYVVAAVHGRDHAQTFVVECTVREQNAVTTGQGQSRRSAEQEAAAAMLAVLTGEQP